MGYPQTGIMPTNAGAFNELQALTRRAFVPTLYVQFGQASPTFAGFMQHAKTASGGIPSITVPVQGAPLTIPQWTGYNGKFDQPQDMEAIQPAEFNLHGIITPLPFYGMQAAVQMDHAVIPKIEAVFNDAGNSTVDALAQAMWSNVTNTDQLIGVMAACDDGTNAQSYGGISRSVSTFWQSKVYSPGNVAPTRLNVLQYITGVQKRSTEMPTMCVMGLGTWLQLAADFVSMPSATGYPVTGYNGSGTADHPNAVFRAVDIAGVPVYADPYCPEGVMMMFNTKYISMYFHEMANFAFTGFESLLPQFQLGWIGAVVSLLELVCVKPVSQGRVGTTGGGSNYTFVNL